MSCPKVDPPLSKVILAVEDRRGQVHGLEVGLSRLFPSIPPTAKCRLPVKLRLSSSSGSEGMKKDDEGQGGREAGEGGDESIVRLYSAFVDAVRASERVWDLLDDVDKHCAVIEPEGGGIQDHPELLSRRVLVSKCEVRAASHLLMNRLGAEEYSSILLELHPDAPSGPCSVRFFGSDEEEGGVGWDPSGW